MEGEATSQTFRNYIFCKLIFARKKRCKTEIRCKIGKEKKSSIFRPPCRVRCINDIILHVGKCVLMFFILYLASSLSVK